MTSDEPVRALREPADERLQIAEQSIRDAPDHARAVFAALAEGVMVVSSGGTVVDANPSAGRILGLAPSELVGSSVFSPPWPLLDEDGRQLDEAESPIVNALTSGAPAGRLAVTVRPDGTSVILVIIGMPLPRSRGRNWVVATLLDVTRERKAELALSASEARFRNLIEHAPDPVLVVGDDGAIRLCNQRTADVFGYSPEQLIGMSIDELVPDTDRAGHATRRRQYHETASMRSMGVGRDLRARRSDGSEFPIEVGLSPITTPEGPCVIAIARDLTERVIAEAAIRADHAMSEFLSRMSHELRTPLNSVLGFAQLLSMGSLSDEQRESVGQILTAGRHLLDLLNDLLDFERARAGHIHFSISEFSVAEVIGSALELVQPMAVEHSIHVDVAPGVGSGVAVQADRQRLLQVLLNLLSNAIKYNRPNGRVLVAARQRGGTVTIDVVDGGRGLDPAQIEQLFQPFERLDADRAGVPGAGVGLALSRLLIEGMDGTIAVSSVPGQGSTFSVHLPASESSIETAAEPLTPITIRREFPGASILYIEDNEVNVRLVERAMAATGATLTVARTGFGGIERARSAPPDAILLDLNLPDLPGETVLRMLQCDASVATVPVIVISADANPQRKQAITAQGARSYITKPIELAELFDRLHDVLA